MQLLVFDLDFTLWDAGGTWCDHTQPPYRIQNGKILDSENSHIRLYPEVMSILNELHQQGFTLAIASRTSAPDWALNLIHLFGIDHYFRIKEIYPKSKIHHFQQIARQSGIEYTNMIFFDDEYQNIQEVATLGVKAIHVPNGLNRSLIQKAFI